MFRYYQATIENEISTFGIGVHSGKFVNLTLKPAPANFGIQFVRTDASQLSISEKLIKAHYSNVVDTRMSTTIANQYGLKVSTIEHLMAALNSHGIDNLVIEIDNEEVPIMDGSSEQFVFLVECAGVKKLEAPRKIVEITREIEVRNGDAYIRVKPALEFSLDIAIDFPSAAIRKQNFHFSATNSSFKADLSRARTFGFKHEVDQLRSLGLARGGSLDNAVVVDGDVILNSGGLRYHDEFVRHKALDCIGDFVLANSYIRGAFESFKPGHALNNAILREIFSESCNYKLGNLVEELLLTN